MQFLKINDLHIQFDGVKILKSINFDVNLNEIVAIVGKSGVGKTTLLKAIAGLLNPSMGSVELEDKPIRKPSNKIGLVFQDYFVFPWLNVEKNIRTGLDYGFKDYDNNRKEDFLNELLLSTNLVEHKEKYPLQLSGGMLQRVAICRALAANPKVLLLDEPFGALDLVTRINLHRLIHHIFDKSNKAILIVTHNINEAVSLADRIILLSESPAEITGEWIIKKPRVNINFLNLSLEQNDILDQILNTLKNE